MCTNVAQHLSVVIPESLHIKVIPDETEDGKDARIVVIWDFELIQGTTVCAFQPVEKPVLRANDDKQGMSCCSFTL